MKPLILSIFSNETLLDKYADESIENLESLEVLKVRPLKQFSSAMEVVQMFGGKDGFLKAVRELEGRFIGWRENRILYLRCPEK